jgi:hypothetical protein
MKIAQTVLVIPIEADMMDVFAWQDVGQVFNLSAGARFSLAFNDRLKTCPTSRKPVLRIVIVEQLAIPP